MVYFFVLQSNSKKMEVELFLNCHNLRWKSHLVLYCLEKHVEF